ncbi:hypothetical protein [Spiroplasma endosymbiont of Amphibalanus improvisus]|uniref:hypothetical protein n=1 Tax=Spiroplasma endosymbiont of Amphibalanus improvisus TaxID=3066327 RepID=UPI00313BC468
MKKIAKILIIIWWSLIGLLLFCSIIILSVPGVGVSNSGLTGWEYIANGDIDWIWLPSSSHNSSSVSIDPFVQATASLLLCAIPILSLIGIPITIKLSFAITRPKSIEFIDAINKRKKNYKNTKKDEKKSYKLLTQKKIDQKVYDAILKQNEAKRESANKTYLELKNKWVESWKNQRGKKNVKNAK